MEVDNLALHGRHRVERHRPAGREGALRGAVGSLLERRLPPDEEGLGCLRSRFHVDEVRVCKHIPVDQRHNAKIDYPRLHEMLDSQ
jgi:hypothetical protein